MGKRTLLADGTNVECYDALIDSTDEVHDPSSDVFEEAVSGDTDPLLALHRLCFSLKLSDDSWLQTNLFHSTCTVNGKVCHFIIDSGSCENVVSDDAVHKLAL